jgi:hypothetical protein
MAMIPKGKKGRNGDYQALLGASKKKLTPKRPAKTGPMKRLFAWIARGAHGSIADNRLCPT